MAEDTYELRLEQEGFHIIPVHGGEVAMSQKKLSQPFGRLTYMGELGAKLLYNCCKLSHNKEQVAQKG